jgi:hypothetical protein
LKNPAATPERIPSGLDTVALLGHLLERLDQRPGQVSPQQYRDVARRLTQALAEVPGDARAQRVLQGLLASLPALGDLYENLHYEHAGLCREPVDAAARAELAARECIARAAAKPTAKR